MSGDAAAAGRPLRITFVMPNPIRIPMGGAKVVYALGSALAARGHGVRVVGPRRAGGGLRDRLMQGAVAIRDGLHGVPDRPYYRADGVETIVVPDPSPGHVPDGDVVVATAWQTAFWVDRLPPQKGEKVLFVQSKDDGRAMDTWRLPLIKIPVSAWLRDELTAAGERSCSVVVPAIDPDEFGLDRPIAGRALHLVAMYHRHPVKGPEVLQAVLGRVRESRPDVPVTVFAARPPSHRLPAGVEVVVRPRLQELRGLYNSASVFVHTSRREGLGLPPLEAAACGAALAASANGGVRSTFDETTARLAPVGDAGTLARHVLDLLGDRSDRVRLAQAARDAVTRPTWATSAATFERILYDAVGS